MYSYDFDSIQTWLEQQMVSVHLLIALNYINSNDL